MEPEITTTEHIDTFTLPNLEFPCRKGCNRTFPSAPSRNMHEIRAHGKKWNTTKNFKGGKKGRKVSPAGRRNISKALKARWAKHRSNQLNGVAELPTDNLAESARAIILTAQVLRSVSVGLKL